LIVGLRVRNVDRAGDAVDVTAHYLFAAHQLDLSRISHSVQGPYGTPHPRLPLMPESDPEM
jgi:hypothetical protein